MKPKHRRFYKIIFLLDYSYSTSEFINIMKINTIITTLIACFTLVGLQVKSEGQEVYSVSDAYYGPTKIDVGASIANYLATEDLSATELWVMKTLVNNQIGKVNYGNWDPDNEYSSLKASGSYDNKLDITVSADLKASLTALGEGIIAKLSDAIGIKVATSIQVSLNWKTIVGSDGHLVVQFQYNYTGTSRKGEVRLSLTLDNIKNQGSPISPAPTESTESTESGGSVSYGSVSYGNSGFGLFYGAFGGESGSTTYAVFDSSGNLVGECTYNSDGTSVVAGQTTPDGQPGLTPEQIKEITDKYRAEG